jgi:membrane protease YdiL (CAAX protease family)
MLQRIQTIYLLVAAGISGGLIFVFNLWVNAEGVKVFAQDEIVYFSMFMSSVVLSLIAIFRYKDRKSQFVLGRLNIILNFILLGLFVYRSLSLSGETEVSEKGIGMLLPIFSIVFLVLANKAIKKDEDLVKSVDRLR